MSQSDNNDEYMSGHKKLKTALEDAGQGQAFDDYPNFSVLTRLDSMNRSMNLYPVLSDLGLYKADRDDNRIDEAGSRKLEIDVDGANELLKMMADKYSPSGLEFEMSSITSEPPVEYDGFEPFPNRLEIKIEEEIKRTLKIKSRHKENAANAIEEVAPSHAFNVIVYKGVVEDNKPPVDERCFVRFSDKLCMRLEDLTARLQQNYANIYTNDWELDDKGNKPFTLWNSRGSYKGVAIPRGTFVKSGVKKGTLEKDVTMATGKRITDQHDYWKRVAERGESPPKQPFPVIARYWDLPRPDPVISKDIILRFEASHEVNTAVLRDKLLPKALEKCKVQPNWTVVEPGKGDEPSTDSKIHWVLIGKHLLNLYRLYAAPETMPILHKLGQRQEARPFPTADQAKQADDKLFGKLEPTTRPRAQPTETSMTQHKVSAIVGKARGKGQAAVMKNVSATKFAEIFKWPKNDDGTWENQAEWLHRSAFSFGGLNETASKLSSQNIHNLIFGTKEANTFMIRPESTIKNITTLEFKRLQALKPKPEIPKLAARMDKIMGTVSTKFGYKHHEEGDIPLQDAHIDKNFKLDERSAARIRMAVDVRTEDETMDQGTAAIDKAKSMAVEEDCTERLGEDKSMEEEAKHNPKWMKTQKYTWLAPQLEYEFQIELSQLNRSMNAKLIIEPFSRVIPMRLEAELDKLVEEHVFGVDARPTKIKEDAPQLDANPSSPSRKRAGSWTTASVGQYGKGTKKADKPLSEVPFTPATYTELKSQ